MLFFHAHREASALATQLPEEPDQFRAACLANLKGSVGLILAKALATTVSILSTSPLGPSFHFAERIYDEYSTHTLSTGSLCIDTHHILTSPS